MSIFYRIFEKLGIISAIESKNAFLKKIAKYSCKFDYANFLIENRNEITKLDNTITYNNGNKGEWYISCRRDHTDIYISKLPKIQLYMLDLYLYQSTNDSSIRLVEISVQVLQDYITKNGIKTFIDKFVSLELDIATVFIGLVHELDHKYFEYISNHKIIQLSSSNKTVAMGRLINISYSCGRPELNLFGHLRDMLKYNQKNLLKFKQISKIINPKGDNSVIKTFNEDNMFKFICSVLDNCPVGKYYDKIIKNIEGYSAKIIKRLINYSLKTDECDFNTETMSVSDTNIINYIINEQLLQEKYPVFVEKLVKDNNVTCITPNNIWIERKLSYLDQLNQIVKIDVNVDKLIDDQLMSSNGSPHMLTMLVYFRENYDKIHPLKLDYQSIRSYQSKWSLTKDMVCKLIEFGNYAVLRQLNPHINWGELIDGSNYAEFFIQKVIEFKVISNATKIMPILMEKSKSLRTNNLKDMIYANTIKAFYKYVENL